MGYIEGPVGPRRHLQDQSFTEEIEDYSHDPGGYISVTCLSIAKEAQGLGLGQKLLTVLKEVAVELDYKGIRLKSPDELLSYFEMNGFIDEEATSLYSASQGYSMIWFNPFYLEAQ